MPKKRTVRKFYSARQQRLAAHASALARQGAHYLPEVEEQRQEAIKDTQAAIEADRAVREQAHRDNYGRRVGAIDRDSYDARRPRAGDEGFKPREQPQGARSRAKKAAAASRAAAKKAALPGVREKTGKQARKEQRKFAARTRCRFGNQHLRTGGKSHASTQPAVAWPHG
jgi:predicted DNA-binding protein